VARSWQVRGCKVFVGGCAATVTGPVRHADDTTLLVPVAFDDGWDPEEVPITFNDGMISTELAAYAA